MPVERRTEGVGLALWWTRQRDRNYLRKRGGGRPLGPGTEGPRVEPVKPEGRRSSPSGGENRKERPFTRLERASSDSNRRILKTVRPVVWEGAGAQSPAPDPIFQNHAFLSTTFLTGRLAAYRRTLSTTT